MHHSRINLEFGKPKRFRRFPIEWQKILKLFFEEMPMGDPWAKKILYQRQSIDNRQSSEMYRSMISA